MDWIEQLFGIAPDNGDGTTEMKITAAIGVLVFFTVGAAYRRYRAWRDGNTDAEEQEVERH